MIFIKVDEHESAVTELRRCLRRSAEENFPVVAALRLSATTGTDRARRLTGDQRRRTEKEYPKDA